MLIEDLKNNNIVFSLQIFEPNDLAIGWEIKAIVDNPDIFNRFFDKYPLSHINTYDDFFEYLFSLKLQSFSAVIPLLLHEEHKVTIAALSSNANNAISTVDIGEVVKYINSYYKELYAPENVEHDIKFVTLDLIMKYLPGISEECLLYLCENYDYLIIDHYPQFEKTIEKNTKLFLTLFPSGELGKICPYRYNEVLDIWHNIIQKGNKDLKIIIESYIITLFDDVVSLANSATPENIMQIEHIIRTCQSFLEKCGSALANKLVPYTKSAEQMLSTYIHEHGKIVEYKMPIEEILEQWKKEENWGIRLLNLTHKHIITNGCFDFISSLTEAPDKTSIMDLVSTNVPTDEYYTMSHQQKLSIYANVGAGTLLGIMQDETTKQDYFAYIATAVKYVSEKMFINEEQTTLDIELLVTSIRLVIDKRKEDTTIVHSLCYNLSMYICAFLEKILRVFYLYFIKEEKYVSDSSITLGGLLTCKEIISVFGEHHAKALAFFLSQTPEKRVGHNYRNRLAHLSDVTPDMLMPSFALSLLWLLTDVINTVFWYFLKDEPVGD